MSGPLRVGPRLTIPPTELAWRFSRASGPGGQGVNTTDSRVELSWDVARSAAVDEQVRRRLLHRLEGRLSAGVLRIVASEHRSQLRNRDAAQARLVELIRDALAPLPPPRHRTRPSSAARERRLEGKRRRARLKALRRADTRLDV